MARISIQRADLLVLVALLLIGLIAAMLSARAAESKKRGGILEIPSTFHNNATGMMAAYLALDRAGYDVRQLRTAITDDALEPFEALVALQPRQDWAVEEMDAVLRWVRGGGRLLLAPGSEGFAEWFGKRQFVGTSPLGSGAPDELREAAAPVTARVGEGSVREDHPLTEGVTELLTRPRVRFETADLANADGPLMDHEPDAVVWWQDDQGAASFEIPVGRGSIIVLGDLYPLSNIGLKQADNPLLLANLGWHLTGGDGAGTIAFDEYHLGYAQSDTTGAAIAKLLLQEGRGWGVAHAGLVVLLALWVSALRFGKPRDVEQRERRRHSEFAHAAGVLLDRAGAIEIAWTTLLEHYRGRLCKLTHLDPKCDDRELADEIKRRTKLDVEWALSRIPPAGGGGRTLLMRTAQTLHRAVEALTHGNQ